MHEPGGSMCSVCVAAVLTVVHKPLTLLHEIHVEGNTLRGLVLPFPVPQ